MKIWWNKNIECTIFTFRWVVFDDEFWKIFWIWLNVLFRAEYQKIDSLYGMYVMDGNLYVIFWTRKYQRNHFHNSTRHVSKISHYAKFWDWLFTVKISSGILKCLVIKLWYKLRNSYKFNGVGKEGFAATWLEHPFVIEGEKIRSQNVLYIKAFLIFLISILALFMMANHYQGITFTV